jgi:hypothetical protein
VPPSAREAGEALDGRERLGHHREPTDEAGALLIRERTRRAQELKSVHRPIRLDVHHDVVGDVSGPSDLALPVYGRGSIGSSGSFAWYLQITIP